MSEESVSALTAVQFTALPATPGTTSRTHPEVRTLARASEAIIRVTAERQASLYGFKGDKLRNMAFQD